MFKLSVMPVINFDEGNLGAGTLVTDQFEGISVSTTSKFGVMVFNTDNPTGDDYDLATEDLGKVLIISEDGDSSDPDDDAAGGTIKIEFDEPITVTSIGLLDIEESGGFIEFFSFLSIASLMDRIHSFDWFLNRLSGNSPKSRLKAPKDFS